jgi:hypothetical protein
VDVIDWILYGIGRLTQMGLNRLGVPIRDMSDGGYATLGFLTVVGVGFFFFIVRRILNA